MFDVGFSELMLIGIVALVVLGPERLPKAARMAGALLRRFRGSWANLRQDLEREIASDDLKKSLREAEQAVQEASPLSAIDQVRRDASITAVQDAVRELSADIKKTESP
jgi:sec-independent protein translocase protein TatB